MRTKVTICFVLMISTMVLTGCLESSAQKGTILGAGGGALAGQLIGGDTKSTAIGAGVGAIGGYVIGKSQDAKRETNARIGALEANANTVDVNITNSNGSINVIRLQKSGVGYVGPRGEYYQKLPSEDQLRPIYGF